jgi:hypothetical protein
MQKSRKTIHSKENNEKSGNILAQPVEKQATDFDHDGKCILRGDTFHCHEFYAGGHLFKNDR